jgi:hypothetical protein
MRFDDIYALQLIKERVRTKNSSYSSYELNLIHKDTTRTNLVDHGKYALLQQDAEMLSSVIGVPLWDGTKKKSA